MPDWQTGDGVTGQSSADQDPIGAAEEDLVRYGQNTVDASGWFSFNTAHIIPHDTYLISETYIDATLV